MEQILRLILDTIAFVFLAIRTAVRSVRDNTGLAALSVVLAFALWVFVTDAENPTRTRVLPVDIPVQPTNVPQDVAVANELTPVRVRVTVAEDVFDSLTAADFEATVDLDGLTVGQYELPVEVRPLTSRGGLRVEAVLPDKIQVDLAQLIAKSVPIVVDVQGEPPTGYAMSTPESEDETAIVTGPEALVNQVSQATATIDISGRTDDVDQAVRLAPRDNRGILIQGVALDPPITDVSIDIEQERFSRSMAVSPEIVGTPADGYNVASVSVNPPAVTVRGDQAYISGTISVPTKPVDIDGSVQDVVQTVSLDLPRGAEVTGGVPTVTVTVRIVPGQGTSNLEVPVIATGLGDGLRIEGSLPTVKVSLSGDLPKLNRLTPPDIRATVDLSGESAGVHAVAVRVEVPEGLTVRSVTPAEVQITIAGN